MKEKTKKDTKFRRFLYILFGKKRETTLNDFVLVSTTDPDNGIEVVLDSHNGKLYTIISCRYLGTTVKYSDSFIFTGKLNKNRELDRRYIEKQLTRLNKCCFDLKNIEGQNTRYLYYKNVTEEIKTMLGGK